MTFDFKNILIGIIVGVLITIVIGALLNDVHIEIQIGDKTKNNSMLNEEI